MAKLWNMTTDASGKKVLEDLDLKTFCVTAPAVIFLTGVFTDDEQAGHIAGAIDRLEEIVDNRAQPHPPTEVYAWSHNPALRNVFDLAAYNFRPNGTPAPATRKLAEKIFKPLLLDDNGQPLPEDIARKNMRNITLFGYSAGSITGQDCFNATLNIMTAAGYDADKARGILKEVVLISVGNMSRPSQEKDRFTTVYLTATNDKLNVANRRIWSPLKSLFTKVSRKLTIKRMSPSSLLISARVSHTKKETRRRKDRTWKERIEPMVPRWMLFRSYHELPRYITEDDGVSPFSKIVLYAVTNAAARAGVMDPLDLIRPPAGVDPATAAAYTARIDKAVRP
jgi:hypothetical protein